MTIKDATYKWVNEFNAIPRGMIDELMQNDPDSWSELTLKSNGDRVYCYEHAEYGSIEAYDGETEMYIVDLDNGEQVQVDESDMCLEYDDGLPMWGTMWSFGDSADDYWLSDKDGIRIMSQCGFRIYEHEEYGYFFGIDGAGYNFYEAHWIPLYQARGLKWHDESDDEEKNYADDEELVGVLGQLLDEHEDDVVMSEKVRQGIYNVYSALCARINNW